MRTAWVCACDGRVADDVIAQLAELGYSLVRSTAPDAAAATAELAALPQPDVLVVAAALPSLVAATQIAAALATLGAPLLVATTPDALGSALASLHGDEVLVVGAPSASADELALRIERAQHRRGQGVSGDHVRLGTLELNLATYEARIDGALVDFTHMEYELLRFLATHPNRVFSREALLERVWGYDYYGATRTVDVHVRRVRAKLGPEHAGRIHTVRSVGYRFER